MPRGPAAKAPESGHVGRDVGDLLAGRLGKGAVGDAGRALGAAELAHARGVLVAGALARAGGLAGGDAEGELAGGLVGHELARHRVAEGGLHAEEPGGAAAVAVADVGVACVVEGFAGAVVVGRVGADDEGEVDGCLEVRGRREGGGRAGGGPDGFLGGRGSDGVGGVAGGGRVVGRIRDAQAGVLPRRVRGALPQGAEIEEGEVGEEEAAVGGLVRELQREVLPAPDLILQVKVGDVEHELERAVGEQGGRGAVVVRHVVDVRVQVVGFVVARAARAGEGLHGAEGGAAADDDGADAGFVVHHFGEEGAG